MLTWIIPGHACRDFPCPLPHPDSLVTGLKIGSVQITDQEVLRVRLEALKLSYTLRSVNQPWRHLLEEGTGVSISDIYEHHSFGMMKLLLGFSKPLKLEG